MKPRGALLLSWLYVASACAAAGEEFPPCATPDDCRAGHRCVNGSCVPPGVDAGPSRDDAGRDAAPSLDAGGADAGTVDAAATDTGAADAGSVCSGACRYYIRRAGSSEWERHAMPGGAFAPTAPVRAAFDIEDDGVAYLLTDATYHILDLATQRFTGGGMRDDLLPEARGVPLVTAETIPAGHAGGDPSMEGLVLGSRSVAYVGHIVRATRTFVIETVVTEFGPEWTGPLAPNRDEVRADWLDATNAEGWVTADPSDFCATSNGRVGPYYAFITPTSVHVYEAGVCFDFVERHAFAAFPPFSAPGAPAAADVVAAFFHQGELHVFVD